MSNDQFGHGTKVLRAEGRRITRSRDRSPVGWVILVTIIVVTAGGAGVYALRPQGTERSQSSPEAARTAAPSQGSNVAPDFSALYQKYNIKPLSDTVTIDRKLAAQLATLQNETCNKRAVYQVSLSLENSGSIREAANLLSGFSSACPYSDGELYHASELYYLLGDYDTAVKLSAGVLHQKPDAYNAYFLRARAEQGLGHDAAAIEDYATVIQLVSDTKTVVSEVFTRMSDSYEKVGQPCEAIAPLQTYIALDNQNRSTPPLLRRISALAAEGNCTLAFARGVTSIPLRPNGVSTTKMQINGVEGTFLIDTGASFMTLSPRFAERAKPRRLATEAVQLETANGNVTASLASLDSVKLGGLSASAVPAIVASKSLGENTDGLLGMSFLSRFTIVIEGHEMQLKAKMLKE